MARAARATGWCGSRCAVRSRCSAARSGPTTHTPRWGCSAVPRCSRSSSWPPAGSGSAETGDAWEVGPLSRRRHRRRPPAGAGAAVRRGRRGGGRGPDPGPARRRGRHDDPDPAAGAAAAPAGRRSLRRRRRRRPARRRGGQPAGRGPRGGSSPTAWSGRAPGARRATTPATSPTRRSCGRGPGHGFARRARLSAGIALRRAADGLAGARPAARASGCPTRSCSTGDELADLLEHGVRRSARDRRRRALAARPAAAT